jgi:hypothetical protein
VAPDPLAGITLDTAFSYPFAHGIRDRHHVHMAALLWGFCCLRKNFLYRAFMPYTNLRLHSWDRKNILEIEKRV